MLRFTRLDMRFASEPGDFEVFIGHDSLGVTVCLEQLVLLLSERAGTGVQEVKAETSRREMEEARAGYNPELSYGSHIFQDLVEAEILYTAVFNNSKTLHFAPEKLKELRNKLDDIAENSGLDDVIQIYDVSRCMCELYNDIKNEHLIITI